MNRRLISLIATSLLAGSAVAADNVANLGAIEGTVMVSKGDKFVTAEAGQALAAGDRILVMDGGKATVAFLDGCALPIAPGSHLVVPEKSTCAGGVAQTVKIGSQVAQGAVGAQTLTEWLAANAAFVAVVGVTAATIVYERTRNDEAIVSP